MLAFPLAALTFLVAVAVTTAVTPLVIRLAGRISGAGRWEHVRSQSDGVPGVPRLGGIAVLSGFAAGVAAALVASGYSGTLLRATRYYWLGWIGATVALFVCGLIDDLRGLRPSVKLAVQFVGALAVYLAGFRIEFVTLPGAGDFALGWLALPATVLWVIGVTNAVNLIDGLDGLATGIAFLSTATVVVISVHQGVFAVTLISVALAGSLLGFLRYNFSPARIYLGDSGSQFLGLTLAVISIRGLQKSATAVAILAPVLLLGLPILDMVLVVLRRTWRIQRGQTPAGSLGGVLRGDREHIHHNLLDLGLSKRKAALILYVTAALFCSTALALVAFRNPALALVVAAVTALATAAFKIWAVRRREEIERSAGGGAAAPAPAVKGRGAC